MHIIAKSGTSLSDTVKLILKKRKELLHEQNIFGQTSLHLAAISGNIEVLNTLIQYGINLEASDAEGLHAVHCAICKLNWHYDYYCKYVLLSCNALKMSN